MSRDDPRPRRLLLSERKRLLELDAVVPRIGHDYLTRGDVSGRRDPGSAAYDVLRKYVSQLLRVGVPAASISQTLTSSNPHMRRWAVTPVVLKELL